LWASGPKKNRRLPKGWNTTRGSTKGKGGPAHPINRILRPLTKNAGETRVQKRQMRGPEKSQSTDTRENSSGKEKRGERGNAVFLERKWWTAW